MTKSKLQGQNAFKNVFDNKLQDIMGQQGVMHCLQILEENCASEDLNRFKALGFSFQVLTLSSHTLPFHTKTNQRLSINRYWIIIDF